MTKVRAPPGAFRVSKLWNETVRVKLVIVVVSALIVAYGFLGGVVETATVGDDPFRDLSVFVEVLHKVRSEYVENPRIDNAMKGALQGMVEALDGYSSYVDPDTHATLRADQIDTEKQPGQQAQNEQQRAPDEGEPLRLSAAKR